MVVEGALEGELDDHLGYSKHDPAGRNGSNSRNGHRAKTVITETGPARRTLRTNLRFIARRVVPHLDPAPNRHR